MTNTPSDAEIDEVTLDVLGYAALDKETNETARMIARAVLAKWGTPQPAPAPLSDAVEHYLEAQDALDNREYGGINAEPYEKLLRRRNASRNDLDAAYDAQGGK